MRRPLALLATLLVGVFALTACGGEPGVEAVGADADESPGGSTAADVDIGLEPRLDPTLPAADVTSPADGVDVPATVVVVGDSLTESAAVEIETTLTQNGIEVLAIDGLTNRRMVRSTEGVVAGTGAVEALLERVETPPELWVVALGTNDVGGAATAEQFASDMGTLLGLLPDGAPVVWVDLWIRDRQPQVLEANAVIRDVLARRGNGAVADWHSQATNEGAITDDGVHLTDDGRWMFARTLTDAVLAYGT